MTAYLIATAVPNPDSGDAMQEYSGKASEILGAAGGKPVHRLGVVKPVVGEVAFAMLMIMEFPDAASIERAFESDEYKALTPMRDKAFSKIDLVIANAP